MKTFPEPVITKLRAAAEAGQIIVIEVIQNGEKRYLNGRSLFGPPPAQNPLDATNYAEDLENDFQTLWYDASSVYVKDVGGGRSAPRSDVPAQIVIFERPTAPSEVGRVEL